MCIRDRSYVTIYLITYEILEVIATIHFIVTGLSLLFLFIAYNEIIIHERKVRKIKKGEVLNVENFPIEKGYKVVFKLLGLGLSLKGFLKHLRHPGCFFRKQLF